MPLHPLQTEWDADLRGGDPLGFPGYGGSPEIESVRTGRTDTYALIEGRFEVIGGSMGAVHGERVVRAYRRAIEARLPVVVLTSSGGARMQEGMVSLIQMARAAAAARAHAAAGLLSIAVYRSPTTGGVYASYASLVDLRAAVAGATIGFAGPRVIEMTTGRPLPESSHTAESAYAAGLVDAVLPDRQQTAWVEAALGLRHWPERFGGGGEVVSTFPEGAWGEVMRARSATRPSALYWAGHLCKSWVDLHGTDPVVRAGLAIVDDWRVVVIATDRKAGAGRPTPAGFRLAQRAAELAGRLGLPLVTLVDTPGADPSPEAEADGIAREIARTFAAFDAVPSPVVSVCVGEGGSGGALALAHADRLIMLQHSVFSVISPEGAATILERDVSRAPELAENLKLTAAHLLDLGVIDEIVPERVEAVRSAVLRALEEAVPGHRRRRADRATARWIK